jgi:hypothetical protein
MRGTQVAKITQHQPGRGSKKRARAGAPARHEAVQSRVFGGLNRRGGKQPKILLYNLSAEALRLVAQFDETGPFQGKLGVKDIKFKPGHGNMMIRGPLRTQDYLYELQRRAASDPRIWFTYRYRQDFNKFGLPNAVGTAAV